MSNRKGADLGLTLALLGYVPPTPASIGAAKNTVGVGLPVFLGRTVGDNHFESGAGREYVLTGASGGSVTEPFTYPNGSLVGQVAPNGQTWVAGGTYASPSAGAGSPAMTNNAAVLPDGSTRTALLSVGSFATGGELKVNALESATNPSGEFYLELGGKTTDYSKIHVRINSNDPGTFGQGFGRTFVVFTDSAGATTTVADNGSNAAGFGLRTDVSIEVMLRVLASGTVQLYFDGVLKLSGAITPAQVATLGAFVGVGGNATTLDNLAAVAAGTLAWTPGSTLTALGYVAPTLLSLGGAKNTVGAGFPSFAGRSQGDNHLNLTDGREYVLTGTPGVPVKSESFTGRANGASIIGTPLEVGGVNWVGSDSASAPTVTSGLIRATSSDDMGAFHALAAGAQDVQADLTFFQLGFCQFGVRCTSGVRGSGYWLVMNSAGVKLYKGGVSTLVATFSAVAVTGGLFRLTVDGSATPTITAYKDGVQIGTPYTDISGSPQTGAAVGWELGQGNGGSITTLDNWSALAVGSLAWTPPAAGGSMNFKGAWASGATYVTNDVVSRAYGLYVALAIPPVGTDPVTPLGAPARVGANGGDIAAGASNFGGAVTDQSFAWPFTVSGPTTVTAVEVLVATSGNIPAGVKVGIASDFASGRTGGAPFLGSHVTTAAMTPGWNTVVLDTPVPLVAGTTYRYVLESGDIRNLQYAGSAGPYTGLVASTNTGLASSGAPSTTYSSTVGLYAPFRIDASPTQYWQKLANTGNQENVGQVAAAGATLTIPDPELQSITRAVLTANVVVAAPPVKSGESFTVVLVQDATGGRTVSWTGGATILWPGGTAPTQTATPGKGDVYSFMSDGAGNWLGFVGGQNY